MKFCHEIRIFTVVCILLFLVLDISYYEIKFKPHTCLALENWDSMKITKQKWNIKRFRLMSWMLSVIIFRILFRARYKMLESCVQCVWTKTRPLPWPNNKESYKFKRFDICKNTRNEFNLSKLLVLTILSHAHSVAQIKKKTADKRLAHMLLQKRISCFRIITIIVLSDESHKVGIFWAPKSSYSSSAV